MQEAAGSSWLALRDGMRQRSLWRTPLSSYGAVKILSLRGSAAAEAESNPDQSRTDRVCCPRPAIGRCCVATRKAASTNIFQAGSATIGWCWRAEQYCL